MRSKFKKNLKAKILGCIFAKPIHRLMLLAAFIVFPQFSYAASDTVCAVVKIEIAQELTLERQAFDANMTITNGLDTASIDNISINVTFTDENGAAILATSDTTSTTAKFFIKVDSMTNISAIDGTDSILPKSTANIHWLIVPAPGSSNGLPSGQLYFVGATLNYNLSGVAESVTVTPDFIYVKPLPLLTMDYFLTQNVIADDPLTAEIEASEPFYLGVRVSNNGSAIAKNVKIDSAQPKIENDQGLLINFLITGSSVNDQPSVPSLLLGLGDIPANGAAVGRWDMETSFVGTFIDFTASFSHADALGGALTSLIQAVNTHFLVRNVVVDAPGRDLVRDFLALDANTLRVYESNGVDTTVTDQSTLATFVSFGTSGADSIYTLTMPITAGLSYVKLVDPFGGANVIKEVVRSDGKYIPLANAWFSRVKNRTTNLWEYYVNFFDVDTTGTYSVRMGPPVYGLTAPTIQFIANRATYEGNQLGFIIQASDVNGDAIAWSASNLPTGATFVDDGNGQATFNWTPAVGQAGSYNITYRATDSTNLYSERSARISVSLANDTDGDGMDDAWEIANFGDLSRDGLGDYDGDGILDIDEFNNNTDPTVVPPLAPANLLVTPGNGETTASWDVSLGATDYTIYWSLSAGVTKASGTVISNINSPYVHTGLANDLSYYYIVTATGVGGESLASNEYSVTTGIKQWGTPLLNETNNLGDVGATRVAMNSAGNAVAVRTQSNGTETDIIATLYTNGVWSADVSIETNVANATNPNVAIDGNNNIIVVWQQDDAGLQSIWQNRYDATTGLWGSATVLEIDALNAALQPSIAMDASGRATVVWSQSDATVHAALFVPATGWLASTRIENDIVSSISGMRVVMDISGNALVTWSNSSDGITYNIMSNRYLVGTGWSATASTVRSAISNDAGATQLIVNLSGDVNGNAIAVWSETDGVRNNIWASHFDPTSGWSSTLNPIESNDVAGAYAPEISMDNAGNAIALWHHADGSTQNNRNIWSSAYTTTGGWVAGITALNSDTTTSTSNAKLKIIDNGSIVVVWQQSDSVNQNIWSTSYDSTLAQWTRAQIIETENLGDASNADLALNSTGDAAVFWQQHDGTRINAWVNTYNVINTGVPNIQPIAITNGDQITDAGISINLDSSASFDQDGSIVSSVWTQTVGTVVVINNANNALADFIAPTVAATEILGFSVTVTDDLGLTATAAVNITVNPGNSAPVVDAGLAQTVAEQTLVNLAGSATDADGTIASLVWTQVSGTAVVITDNGDGTASFTAPAVTASENLLFRLTATDDLGAISSADVTITVDLVNVAPTVTAGVAQTVSEQTIVALSGSATDSDGTITSLVWTQVSGTVVTLTDNADGTASFTAPTLIATDVLTFRLTATDDNAAVSSADVVITVDPVNALPTVSAGIAQSVDEQLLVNLSGSASDSDGTLTSIVWSQISGTAVVITDAGTGAASFTAPTLTVTDILNFRITATDNEGGVSTADVAITVNPVNALPTVSAGTAQTVDEQVAVTLTGSASDTDGTIATQVWSQLSGTIVVLTDTGTGSASFTAPTLTTTEILNFRITATDNEGGVSTADVAITVNPVNALPTVSAGIAQTVDEQVAVTLTGSASDTDGTIATQVWSQLSGTIVVLTDTGTGSASFTAPTLTATDILNFRITATDNEGGVSTADVAITVNPVNAAPTADAGTAQTIDEQTLVTLTGSATDTDGTIATQVWTQLTGTIVVITDSGTGSASFTAPTLIATEILSFRFTVTDNEGAITTADVSVTVNPVNTVPTVTPGPAQTVDEQTLVSLSGSATDVDGTITSLVWTQAAGTVVVLTDNGDGSASFTTPTLTVTDSLVFTLTATDNEGGVSVGNVAITVNPVNALPVVSPGALQTVNEQVAVSLSGSATDADGTIASLVWSQVSGTSVVLTDAGDGTASFTAPTLTVTDTLVLRLTATDNEGGISSADVSVVVNPVNALPTATVGTAQTVLEQTLVNVSGSATDTDGTIASLVWSQLTGTAVVITDDGLGAASFTAPTITVSEVINMRLTATDNEGGIATADVAITVTPVNAVPTVTPGADQIVNEQTLITLSGSALDSDGTIATLVWTQVTGTLVTLTDDGAGVASFTSPTLTVSETLSFRLTATDNEGAVASADVAITVQPVNALPTVNPGAAQSVADRERVNLAGSATDVDGTIGSLVWSQVSGVAVSITDVGDGTASFVTPVVSATETLIFRLTATDNEAGVASADVIITLTPSDKGSKISASKHSCAIKTGVLWCWGENNWGQLGNGTTSISEKPVQVATVATGTEWIAVATGSQHTCAIRDSGEMYCWGFGYYGELGNAAIETASDKTSSTPILVDTPVDLLVDANDPANSTVNWTQVVAGYSYTCGIHSNRLALGQLFCWGYNSYGSLGNTDLSTALVDEFVPQAVLLGNDLDNNWVEVKADFIHTCGIRQQTNGSTLWCWGNGGSGQLGNGLYESSLIPSQVMSTLGSAIPDTDWINVAVGVDHSCGIRADSTLWCWGLNTYGGLGNPAQPSSQLAPIQEGTFAVDWIKVYAHQYQTCGLKRSGEISCWGKNNFGQAGNASLSKYGEQLPTLFAVNDSWSEVALGDEYTCAINDANSLTPNAVSCWGSAERNYLGGDAAETALPVQVGLATDWLDVSTSIRFTYEFTLGIRGTSVDNSMYSWGSNYYGFLGNGDSQIIQEQQPIIEVNNTLTTWKKLSAGGYNACGIQSDDTLYCWGRGWTLPLSSGNTATPVQVDTDLWLDVDSGQSHTCGIKSDNSLWCWGEGYYGELGADIVKDATGAAVLDSYGNVIAVQPDTANGIYMIQVVNPSATTSWVSISAGQRFTCAIDNLQDLYCWGYNRYGNLGLGTITTSSTDNNQYVPTKVTTPAGVLWSKVSTAKASACGITDSGNQNLYCWGTNSYGQLGIDNLVYYQEPSPVVVTTVSTTSSSYPWEDVSSNSYSTCARKADSTTAGQGSLWCWGVNDYGGLGNGDNSYQTTYIPNQVLLGTEWKNFTTGNDMACGIKALDNTLWCWGRNYVGQLGTNSSWSMTPLPLALP